MASGSSGQSIELKEDRIKKALAQSLKAHKSPDKLYLHEETRISSRSEVIFSFPACGSVKDWYSGKSFGESKIDSARFRSLKSVGNDELAEVNTEFLRKFEEVLGKAGFKEEVEKGITKQKKQVVFTGHSSGAAVAILATLWALDNFPTRNTDRIPPLCITFGSPLIGNRIFAHATRREKWSGYFMHFVMKYDILPRLLLAPRSSLDQKFDPVLQFFIPKSKSFLDESIADNSVISEFYFAVMKNAANAASHAACKLMGSTNAVSETLANFIPLSPYRPFGTYIFCTGTGKLTVVRNPEAVLQLLFFSAQSSTEAEIAQVASRCLKEHLIYGKELEDSLAMQSVVYLDGDIAANDMALNDLGLSERAKLCLRAAGEFERQKIRNEQKINMKDAKENMKKLEDYKAIYETQKVSYYDAFKLQHHEMDFKSNVNRLKLASVWDEIVEMLRNYELPDEFEGNEEWVKLGTAFRRLVEPLDVANYYRHVRNDTTGPYLQGKGRPRRYKYTQKWLEHDKRKPDGTYAESCLMARVEELSIRTKKGSSFEEMKEDVLKLEEDIKQWNEEGVLSKYVLLKDSTLEKWWNGLPSQHKECSYMKRLIEEHN